MMYYQILITNIRRNVSTGKENLYAMLVISRVTLIPSTEQSVADVKQVNFGPSFWKQLCWIIRILGTVRLQLHNKIKVLVRNAPSAIHNINKQRRVKKVSILKAIQEFSEPAITVRGH